MENNQTQNPEVSVIIPTYNRERLIMRAIQSVLNQSFKNWEMIIVDDGSKDNTHQIIKSLLTDPRIIYLKLEKNVGMCEARNLGIRKARGKFIAFLDSDDEWLPAKLEKQLDVFAANIESTGLVYTGAFFINIATGERRIRLARKKGNIFDTQLTENPIGGSSRVMVRKVCFDQVGYFDPDFTSLEDWEMWTRIATKYSVDVVPEPLINYYEGYADSLSVNTDRLVQGYEALWRKYKITPEKKNILEVHYAKLGHRLLFYGDLVRGRRYLEKAFRMNWWNPKHVILLLASFLGVKTYRRITFLALQIKQ